MEHKAELDSIKVTYARMQAQLEETHKLLNDEHRRRFQVHGAVVGMVWCLREWSGYVKLLDDEHRRRFQQNTQNTQSALRCYFTAVTLKRWRAVSPISTRSRIHHRTMKTLN